MSRRGVRASRRHYETNSQPCSHEKTNKQTNRRKQTNKQAKIQGMQTCLNHNERRCNHSPPHSSPPAIANTTTTTTSNNERLETAYNNPLSSHLSRSRTAALAPSTPTSPAPSATPSSLRRRSASDMASCTIFSACPTRSRAVSRS